MQRGFDLLKAKSVCREGVPFLATRKGDGSRVPRYLGRLSTGLQNPRPSPLPSGKNCGDFQKLSLRMAAEPSTPGTSDRRVQIKASQFPLKVSCFQNYSLLGSGWVFVFVSALVLNKALKQHGQPT